MKLLAQTVVASLLAVGAQTSFAAPCSVGNYLNGATSTYLKTDNVVVNGISANDCLGHVDPGSASLTNVTNYINSTALADPAGPGMDPADPALPAFGGNWSGILQATAAGNFGTGLGLTITIEDIVFGANDTTFNLKVTDPNPAVAPGIPVLIDLLFGLKAGNETDLYFFNDFTLLGTNASSYQVAVRNNPNNAFLGLSNFYIWGRDPRDISVCQPGDPICEPQRVVPEPGVLALSGVALFALALVRRRKANV